MLVKAPTDFNTLEGRQSERDGKKVMSLFKPKEHQPWSNNIGIFQVRKYVKHEVYKLVVLIQFFILSFTNPQNTISAL